MSEEMESIVEFSEDIGEAEPPKPLPDGDYIAEIKGAERKTSATSGNDYARVTFHIAPENYPADYEDAEEEPDGLTITWNMLPLVDNRRSRFRLRKFCEAIGAPMSNRLDMSEWVGLETKVYVESETWEGLDRNVIKRVSSPD